MQKVCQTLARKKLSLKDLSAAEIIANDSYSLRKTGSMLVYN